MAELGKVVSEFLNHELPPHNSTSTRHGHSSHIHYGPVSSSEMTFMRCLSISPSRGRALTTNSAPQSQVSRPRISSVGLPSREPSQDAYRLHPYYEDPRIRRGQRSKIEPRYVERYPTSRATHSNDDSDLQQEPITTPPSEEGQQLTPLTDASSRTSENGELRKLLEPNNPCGGVQSEPKEHPSYPPEASDSTLEIDRQLKNALQKLSLVEENDMDDGDWQSESQDDFFEQRWVPTNKDFEARVLRATENNFNLAARLIPRLYEIFQQEESHIVGFWEAGCNKRVGNSYDQSSGRQGGKGESLRSYVNQNTYNHKKQRGDSESNGEGSNNNQDGDRDGDGGNRKGGVTGDSQPLPLACPFNKMYPLHYNSSYRSSNGKPVYKSCGTGFIDYQRFREHLLRTHRWVQCEKCSHIFTVPQQERELAYQIHLNASECGNSPPAVNEGITELQWARINSLQAQSQITAKSSNLLLNVVKWNNVWEVLFPGEAPHQPWYTPNIDQHSNLDEEIEEFKRCYASEANEHLSPMENAIGAFRIWFTWFIKRRIDHQDLQETQQQISQNMSQEYTGPQTIYSSLEESQLEIPINFPNTAQFQGHPEMPRALSHQRPLQQYSSGQEFQNTSSIVRRNATEPSLGYQPSGYLPLTSPPVAAYGGLNLIDLQDQQINYQSEHGSQAIFNEPSGLPLSASSETHLEYQSAVAMDYGAFGDSKNHPEHSGDPKKYSNNSTTAVISEAPRFQQTNFTRPQYPTYHSNQVQTNGIEKIQGYTSASLTTQNPMSTRQQMQSQQANLPYQKPHPNRSLPPDTTNYFEPNARYDTYNG